MKNSKPKAESLSLSGYKILKLLEALSENALDEKEINNLFLNDNLIKKEVSNDTIRLYINTLKKIGFKIAKPSKSNSYKYTFEYNPFGFHLSGGENEMLSTLIKYLAKINDWEFILEVDEAFRELQKLSNSQKQHILSSLTNITGIDKKIILQLQKHCEKKHIVNISQKSLTSDEVKQYMILTDEMFVENEKLYIWGYNFKQNEMQYFRVDRICKIKKIGMNENVTPFLKKPTATYKLKNSLLKTFKQDENQRIISKNSKEIIIEEEMINKFKFIQKILSYGKDCVLISPKEIVDDLKTMLQAMEQTYEQ